jgi:hypothetical protein
VPEETAQGTRYLEERGKGRILLLELLDALVDVHDGAAEDGVQLEHRIPLGKHLAQVLDRHSLALQLVQLLHMTP